jgi:hypothetical protein
MGTWLGCNQVTRLSSFWLMLAVRPRRSPGAHRGVRRSTRARWSTVLSSVPELAAFDQDAHYSCKESRSCGEVSSSGYLLHSV